MSENHNILVQKCNEGKIDLQCPVFVTTYHVTDAMIVNVLNYFTYAELQCIVENIPRLTITEIQLYHILFDILSVVKLTQLERVEITFFTNHTTLVRYDSYNDTYHVSQGPIEENIDIEAMQKTMQEFYKEQQLKVGQYMFGCYIMSF